MRRRVFFCLSTVLLLTANGPSGPEFLCLMAKESGQNARASDAEGVGASKSNSPVGTPTAPANPGTTIPPSPPVSPALPPGTESGAATAAPEAPPTPSGTLLLLVPDMAFDPNLSKLEHRLKSAATDARGPLLGIESVFGAVGHDPGAWRQAAAFVRAAFWFTLARQGIQAQDDVAALKGLRRTREVLEQGGLLTRSPLLASIELLTGRIYVDRSEPELAEEAFRTAALIDPSDLSDQLPSGPVRARYLAARKWVQDAERIPLRIEVNTEGPGEVQLYINGGRVMGKGPMWLIELPPGRHLVSAVREGTRPDSQAVVLQPSQKAPGKRAEVFLRLEPGAGAGVTLKLFSLAEVNGFLEQCQSLLTRHNAARLMVEVGARTPKAPEGRLGPKVGIQSGIRLNPGPDAGDDPAPVPHAEVEFFSLDTAGHVGWMGKWTLR